MYRAESKGFGGRKMKKLIALIITLCLCLALCACEIQTHNEYAEEETKFRFVSIYYENGCTVWVDTETGVMYLWHGEGYKGGLSVMVDTNGNPLIWEGYND
jgi:hypothetical protein